MDLIQAYQMVYIIIKSYKPTTVTQQNKCINELGPKNEVRRRKVVKMRGGS